MIQKEALSLGDFSPVQGGGRERETKNEKETERGGEREGKGRGEMGSGEGDTEGEGSRTSACWTRKLVDLRRGPLDDTGTRRRKTCSF